MSKLSYRDRKELAILNKRVDYIVKDGIQWINPTISPAPKRYETNEIESLRSAMEYYSEFTDTVTIQTKYMGSYCSIYFHKDHTKTYFVTRNGYKIKQIDNALLQEKSKHIHDSLGFRSDEEIIIVESELLPWRALGDGLIKFDYDNYGSLHQHHLDFLKTSSITEKINKLRELKPWENDNLKAHEKRQYESLRDVNITDYQSDLDLYLEQLKIFGYEGEIEFKPFNILKVIKTDGSEILIESHYFIGDVDDNIVIKVDDYESAYKFLDEQKALKREGVMVKPIQQGFVGIAPCLKVRTNDYLQLIYGVDFKRNFDFYMNKRNIKQKLRASIYDYELNQLMIRVPKDKLKTSYFKNLVFKLLDGELITKTFDSRL